MRDYVWSIAHQTCYFLGKGGPIVEGYAKSLEHSVYSDDIITLGFTLHLVVTTVTSKSLTNGVLIL